MPRLRLFFGRCRALSQSPIKSTNSGIVSHECESSVRGSARVPSSQEGWLRNYFDLSLRRGAMIDEPAADSFNPNKEIGLDSP